MGPFGVIPKPFRMVSYSEASPNGKAVSNGWPFRIESYSMWSRNPCVHAVGKTPNRMAMIWLDFDAPPPGPKEGARVKGPNDPWDPLGYGEAILNGKLFQPSPNEMDGLFRGFTQTRKRRTECLRICLVGFGRI